MTAMEKLADGSYGKPMEIVENIVVKLGDELHAYADVVIMDSPKENKFDLVDRWPFITVLEITINMFKRIFTY